MQFEFSTATRIIFGAGKLNTIGDLVQEFGKNALIISGGPNENCDRLVNILESHEIACTVVKINREPTIDIIRNLVDFAKESSPEMIIGIGGGSTLDSAKATAVLVSNPGDVTEYLEVIGQNKPLHNPSVSIIAIPTTSGTGSEVTKNAVLDSPEQHVKVSLRSNYMFAKIALVDPELTTSLPQSITAFTGLDALTQLIEPYTCNTPNPLTDALCLEGIRRIVNSIYQAYENGNDLQARENMSMASLFGGLALANARLGAVHGLAGPLGGEISAPHGAICARLLPKVIEANLRALTERSPKHLVLERYKVISKILCGDNKATLQRGLEWISNFCTYVKVPPLSNYGLSEAKFDKIIDKAVKSSSMKGNALPLSVAELRTILQESL